MDNCMAEFIICYLVFNIHFVCCSSLDMILKWQSRRKFYFGENPTFLTWPFIKWSHCLSLQPQLSIPLTSQHVLQPHWITSKSSNMHTLLAVLFLNMLFIQVGYIHLTNACEFFKLHTGTYSDTPNINCVIGLDVHNSVFVAPAG